jgi:hypothetical protein
MVRSVAMAGMIGGWTLCAASSVYAQAPLPEGPGPLKLDALSYGLSEAVSPQFSVRSIFSEQSAAPQSLDAIALDRFGGNGEWGFSVSSHLTAQEDGWGNLNQGNGAELRIGQRLRESIGVLDSQSKPGWFLFAGGGGQALTYSPGAAAETAGGAVRLQDRVRVGSMQAGVGIQHHGMEASLGYVRKEINFGDSLSRQQHFAGVSLTLRR